MTNVDPVEVVLVEDNAQDAELILRVLKKNNLANNIFTIDDGAEAVDYLFRKGKYSNRNMAGNLKIILLDLKLPKVNGLEILKMVKADNRTKYIPVVILTSSSEDPDIKTAYEMGANSYVVKPVGFDPFVEAIGKMGDYWLLINKPPQ
jgi:two-component system response regulator